MSTSDDDIDAFYKSTHVTKSAQSLNEKIMIHNMASQALKSHLFDLKYRELCGSIPYAPILQVMDLSQLSATRKMILEAKHHQYRRENKTHIKIEVPDISSNNLEDFDL